ncbi:AAA family ATPase [Candidatus Chloroploca sp. M-50]|uniref:AAA family ATPase n=1 Tax=Candidatus Chloroploca mongolica TaxID=2528176 RepID=A0ABS4D9R5_9CHLR|nr:AAA family ATPase [Candidatus Chloroploca mongolica]MBP1466186.1 AAA family ATPase [Candidatus Chloroploca mongolica]
MSREERAHLQRLMAINRAHLRELEVQQAKFGSVHVPSHIILQIADYQQQIAQLEEQMTTMLPRHNLPPRDYERFVGRQTELAEVRRLLGSRSRAFVITIDGIGGIGKSALALEAAYNLCESYADQPESERFDAIVWASAKRSYLTADGILERRQVFRALNDLYAAIAQVLDFPAITRARAEEQRTIVEQVLTEQRTLLILDNLETVDDEELMAFLRELPDPTKALVTTRHRIDVAHPIRLTGMPHPDALVLIAQEAMRKRVPLAPDDHEQLWQRTGGVPLAIVWSIGLMGLGGSVESVLRRLGSGQSDIAQFCFAESVAQIRVRDAYWLLLALSLFATDASREALGVVAGLGEDHFGRDVGLEELLRLSLVNKDADRFSLLPLTRSYVQGEIIGTQQWIEAAQERWQAYFSEFAATYGGWNPDWRAHNLVEQDLPNILAVLHLFIKKLNLSETQREDQNFSADFLDRGKYILNLIPKVTRVCRLRGYWSDCDQLSMLGVQLGRLLNALEEVGWRYYDLSRISYFRGDIELAEEWAREARLAWEHHSPQRLCYADRILGLVALDQGRIADAEYLITEAFKSYGQLLEGYMASNFLDAMGSLEAARGNVDDAIKWYRQSIVASKKADNVPGLSLSVFLLGVVYSNNAEIKLAQECCMEALQLARECGRADVIARAYYQSAKLYHQEDAPLANEYTHYALDLFRRLGMKREQAEAESLLRQLGERP